MVPQIDATAEFLELDPLIGAYDCIFEATIKSFMSIVAEKILDAGKTILTMSVGSLIYEAELVNIAKKKRGILYFPSGAICGPMGYWWPGRPG